MAIEKLNWIDFLNEACTWETKVQAEKYFSKIAGVPLLMTPVQASSLNELEEYMRAQLAALHFQQELELDFINERLPKLQLQLTAKKSPHRNKNLPSLSAAGKASNKPVQQIIDTLLFQFALFLGDTIDGAMAARVQRCEALYRSRNVEDCKSHYKRFRSLEFTWKEELVPASQPAGDIERCVDFFVAIPGTKFCSDACRFNSFSLRKQIQTPGYQSEKQRRYRERQKAKS